MRKTTYESPSFELTETVVEQGIAASVAGEIQSISIDEWNDTDGLTITF